MDTIPYIGAHTVAQSPMGLIIPLALAAAVLLLLSAYKPGRDAAAGSWKSFLTGAVIAAAVIWTGIWGWMVIGYNTETAEAAESAALSLNAVYGLEISEEAATAIVRDDLDGYEFMGTTEQDVMILGGEWEDGKLHLYSRGFEAAVLEQAGDEH